jgi:hypothetical protein
MDDAQKNPKPQEVTIEIDDATAGGVYANVAVITHSETEFVIDFIFHSPQPPKAKVRSRVITNPSHAKRLLAALQDNVARYESRFGPIKINPEAQGTGKVGFFH